MSCRLHLVGVNAENSVVMSSSVGKIFLYLVRELISVGLTRVARHTNTAKGVNSSFERLVGLKSDDYLVFLVNVSCRIVAERGHRACVDREDSASLSLKLLKLAQLGVQRFGTLGSTAKEACVLGVRRIVFVDKVADVDVLTPISRHKILPRIKFHHSSLTFLCNCCLRYGCSDKKTKHPRYFGAAQTVGYKKATLPLRLGALCQFTFPSAPRHIYYTIRKRYLSIFLSDFLAWKNIFVLSGRASRIYCKEYLYFGGKYALTYSLRPPPRS